MDRGWDGNLLKQPPRSQSWDGMAESQRQNPKVHGRVPKAVTTGMAWQSPKRQSPKFMEWHGRVPKAGTSRMAWQSPKVHMHSQSPQVQLATHLRRRGMQGSFIASSVCVCILNLYINNMRNHIRSTWAPNCAYSQPALARSLQPTTNQCGYPQTPLQFNHPMVNHGALM